MQKGILESCFDQTNEKLHALNILKKEKKVNSNVVNSYAFHLAAKIYKYPPMCT